jgi:hypothetical protein
LKNLVTSTCFAIVASTVAVSCAVVPPAPITGKTTTSPKLQMDAFRLLAAAFQAKASCTKIEVVETEVLSVGADVEGNQAGAVTRGSIKERWVAVGCGQRMPLEFTFTPDGKGGAYIGFALKK